MAIICPFTIKCIACKYSRPDPDRNGEYSCFLKADLEEQTKQERKEETKMKVYVVISNGELKGEIEGVFSTYEKAKECFESIKKDWQDWAKEAWSEDSDIDEEDMTDHYYLANYDSTDEPLQVDILEEEVQ